MGDYAGTRGAGTRLLAGPAPVVVLAVVAAVWAGTRGGFTDLSVYQHAGRTLLDGLSVTAVDDPVTGLPFTYPPFAALAMAPLAPLPIWLAAAVWGAGSVAALAGAVVLVRRALDRPAPGWLVALLAAGALALEPVWQNLTFGQVNTFLMLLVLVDLLGPSRRWSGVWVGLAAGLKLTPLVFVVLLVLVGRRTAAGRALLTFAATVVVGLVAVPGATAYWTDSLLRASRVGPPELAHNQSVYGALTRLLDQPPPMLLWLAVAVPVSAAILAVGAAWWRRGDRVLGACLAALAMLVASPISWSHHWVWAVPVAMVLWERSRWASVLWTAVFVTRPLLWPPWGKDAEFGWGPPEHLLGNAYLIAAVALAVWSALVLSRPASPAPMTSGGSAGRSARGLHADRPARSTPTGGSSSLPDGR